MALACVLGGSLFATTVQLACALAVSKAFAVDRLSLVRDAVCCLFATLLLVLVCDDGHVFIYEAALYVTHRRVRTSWGVGAPHEQCAV